MAGEELDGPSVPAPTGEALRPASPFRPSDAGSPAPSAANLKVTMVASVSASPLSGPYVDGDLKVPTTGPAAGTAHPLAGKRVPSYRHLGHSAPPAPLKYKEPFWGPKERNPRKLNGDVAAVAFDDQRLPNWLRDNYFLQHGHRVEMNSWHECFRSLGFWHNETANIYTHLVGFAVLSVWGVFSMVDLASREPTVDDEETGPFFISWLLAFVRRHADVFAMVPTFIGAISCLGFSAVFHLVYCHSPKVCHHANKLDYAGIILLISGSTLSTVYFGLRCDGDLRLPYLTFSMATGFICCYVLVYKSSLQSPRYAWLRVAAFTMLACSGLVPVLHSLRRHDWSYVNMAWQFTTYTLPSGMMQLVGGVMYAIKFPERFAPGRFDYLFHSHANFHVIVVAAIVVHAVGLWNCWYLWHGPEQLGLALLGSESCT